MYEESKQSRNLALAVDVAIDRELELLQQLDQPLQRHVDFVKFEGPLQQQK